MYEAPLTALVLSGGGARAAYQVGVLRAISRLRRQALGTASHLPNPFGVICGTSAGALNAMALAIPPHPAPNSMGTTLSRSPRFLSK